MTRYLVKLHSLIIIIDVKGKKRIYFCEKICKGTKMKLIYSIHLNLNVNDVFVYTLFTSKHTATVKNSSEIGSFYSLVRFSSSFWY